MSAIPAVAFLAAALLTSLIGRALLVKAAFGVNAGWGLTVMFVPFGPLFFRMNYREQAYPTRYWRMATGPLLLLFFLDGGSAASLQSLTQFGKSETTEASSDDTHFHLPVPGKLIALAFAQAAPATTPTPTTTPESAGTTSATPTPSKAVAAAASAMSAAPKVLSPAERVEANRKEFERLAEWYDALKHERGYLRKGDTAAVDAFNQEAAKYQTALQLAKNEQAELARLTAKK